MAKRRSTKKKTKRSPKGTVKKASGGKREGVLAYVPKPLITDPKLIAPPSLPMRHDHSPPQPTEAHPEVRLVLKTKYMEQMPHVLLIESVLMSTIITIFFWILLLLLRIGAAFFLPVLLPVWTLLVILTYKFLED